MKIFKRVFLSVVAVLLYGWINAVLNPIATIMSAQMAAKQFENSDTSYVESQLGMNFFGNLGIPSIILLGVLLWIWWEPLKSIFKDGGGLKALALTFLAAGMMFGSNDTAYAYYDKSDYAENYFILPNESAFFVPDVGANKDSQASFGSEKYYQANKIAAKRYGIPHTKLENSGLWSNYYVPTGRLIIVDRTPYSREWTASKDRGTSTKDQSLPCQSKEGIDVTTEIAITTSILEENSAKYLFHFGVEPPAGNRADPNVIFTSVYHARNLNSVMDTVVRTKIQGLVCKQIGNKTLDQVNEKSTEIMTEAEKEVTAFLLGRGITLDSMGWAGTFTFTPGVQKAIDDRFIASTISGSLATLKSLADIEVKRGLAEGLKKGLPSFLPPVMGEWIAKIFGSSSDQPTSQATPKR